MAPEQNLGMRPTLKCDIFSLGMTFVAIVNGRTPSFEFDIEYAEASNRCIKQFGKDELAVSVVLEMVQNCISIDCDDRPTANECVEVLEALVVEFDESPDSLKDLLNSIPTLYDKSAI